MIEFLTSTNTAPLLCCSVKNAALNCRPSKLRKFSTFAHEEFLIQRNENFMELYRKCHGSDFSKCDALQLVDDIDISEDPFTSVFYPGHPSEIMIRIYQTTWCHASEFHRPKHFTSFVSNAGVCIDIHACCRPCRILHYCMLL
jgi:hypothetical protein